MNSPQPDKIVVLGMMSKMPVAGVVWQTVHYLLSLELLGFETYYVEAHARTPSMLMERADDDSSAIAAAYISSVMHRFGFDRRWAFHARHADNKCYGMSEKELNRLYREAACILNLHGGTEPQPEHSAPGRLVYIETDPVQLQAELAANRPSTIDFLAQHCAHFTFAENWDNPDCLLPSSDRFHFEPTRQPVVVDLWRTDDPPAEPVFTTVGNWDQAWRDVVLDGETYRWSKKHEFLRFLDLPLLSSSSFELALSGCTEEDRALLQDHGWRVRNGLHISTAIDDYRSYIRRSQGEFTVAKDQNVRLRTGWFSDRSATFLAAGRPVVTQDTGFGNILPTGEGLFAFNSTAEALGALGSIGSDYERHARAAGEIGREFFSHDVVMRPLLRSIGLSVPGSGRGEPDASSRDGTTGSQSNALRVDLVIEPVGKNPLTLPGATVDHVLSSGIPTVAARSLNGAPTASVVVVTLDNLVLTRLCLESVLVNTEGPPFELIVVDNGSSEGTVRYLAKLAELHEQVLLIRHRENLGFPRAVNAGLAASRGEVLVILNNDTIVPPGWLTGLVSHLEDPEVGLVGPVTNEAANEARIATAYRTYGEMLAFSSQRPRDGARREVPMLTMFCVAMRRQVYLEVGPLDDRFGLGMFEDDDYAMRIHAVGYRADCAEDIFVHHFGGASLGELVPTGEHRQLFDRNRSYFERKWSTSWLPHEGRVDDSYEALCREVRAAVDSTVPPGSRIAVVSKGDDRLVDLPRHVAWHFPRNPEGTYAGFYPADDGQAVAWLEELRRDGCSHVVFPTTSAWWLDHYAGLRKYLEVHGERCTAGVGRCVIFRFTEPEGSLRLMAPTRPPRQSTEKVRGDVER